MNYPTPPILQPLTAFFSVHGWVVPVAAVIIIPTLALLGLRNKYLRQADWTQVQEQRNTEAELGVIEDELKKP